MIVLNKEVVSYLFYGYSTCFPWGIIICHWGLLNCIFKSIRDDENQEDGKMLSASDLYATSLWGTVLKVYWACVWDEVWRGNFCEDLCTLKNSYQLMDAL